MRCFFNSIALLLDDIYDHFGIHNDRDVYSDYVPSDVHPRNLRWKLEAHDARKYYENVPCALIRKTKNIQYGSTWLFIGIV